MRDRDAYISFTGDIESYFDVMNASNGPPSSPPPVDPATDPLQQVAQQSRPSSASSFSDVSTSDASTSNGSRAERGSAHVRIRKMRRTWRQSIKEQEDEESVSGLSEEDSKAKCKRLQAKVRELQDQLLEANTEVTRLENANVSAKQTAVKSSEALDVVQLEKTKVQQDLETLRTHNVELKDANAVLITEKLRAENEALSREQEYRKAMRDLDKVQRVNSGEFEHLPDQEQLMSTIALLKNELHLLREDKSSLQQALEEKDKAVRDIEAALEASVNGMNNEFGMVKPWPREAGSDEKASFLSELSKGCITKLKELKDAVEKSGSSEDIQKRCSDLQGEIAKSHAVVDTCFEQASRLRSICADRFCSVIHVPYGMQYELDSKLTSLTSMLDDAVMKAHSRQRDMDESEKKIKHLQLEMDKGKQNFETELEIAKQELDSVIHKSQKKDLDLASMQNKVHCLEEEVAKKGAGGGESSEDHDSKVSLITESKTKFSKFFNDFLTEMNDGRDTVVAKENLMIKTAQMEVDFVSREADPTEEELDELDKAHLDIDSLNETIKEKEATCVKLIHDMKETFLVVAASKLNNATTSEATEESAGNKAEASSVGDSLAKLLKPVLKLRAFFGEEDEELENLDESMSGSSDVFAKLNVLGNTLSDVSSRVDSRMAEMVESKTLLQRLAEHYKAMCSGDSDLEPLNEDADSSSVLYCFEDTMRRYRSLLDIDRLKSEALKSCEEEVARLRKELENTGERNESDSAGVKEQKDRLEKELEEVMVTNKNLTSSIAIKNEEVVHLREQLANRDDQHMKKVMELEHSIVLLRDEAHHEVQHLATLEAELQKAKQVITDLETRHAAAWVELNVKHEDEIMKLTIKNAEERSELLISSESEKELLRSQLSNTAVESDEKEAMTGVVCELQTSVSRLTSEIESQKLEMSSLRESLMERTTAEAELAAKYEAQISDLNESLSKLTSEKENLQSELNNTRSSVDIKITNESETIEKYELQITELRQMVSKLEEKESSLSVELSQARTKLEEDESKVLELRKYLSGSEAQVESLEIDIEKQKAALEEKTNKELQIVEKYDLQISELRKSLTELETERENLKVEISTIQATQDEKASSTSDTIEKYMLQVTDLHKSTSTLESEREALKLEITNIQTALDEKISMEAKITEQYEAKISELQAAVANVESEREALKVEITTLQVNIEDSGAKGIQSVEQYEVQITELQECLRLAEAGSVALKAEVETLKSLASRSTEHGKEVEKLRVEALVKDGDLASYQEQVKQHAITIVAIEERLNSLVTKNKEYRDQIEGYKVVIDEKNTTIEELSSKETIVEESILHTHPRIIVQQGAGASQTNQQSLVRLRRENANLKNQNTQAQKVIEALRRDISGLAARLTDVAGEVEETTKRQYDDNRTRLNDADRELASHKVKVKELFKIVDEKVSETKRLTSEHKKLKEVAIKLKKAATDKETLTKELEDKLDKFKEERQKEKEKFETEILAMKEVAVIGSSCKGERHEQIIANQRDALNELRGQIKAYEQYPRPGPSHDEALQQVMLLKKELAEIRAREGLKETVGFTVSSDKASTTTEDFARITDAFESTAQRINVETVDLSESSYLNLLRAVGVALEFDEITGDRRLAHIPADEQLRLFREREQACTVLANRIRLLRERLQRKEELLMGYEEDLAKLRQAEELVKIKEVQIEELTKEIRMRTEESQCLRHTMEKSREKEEQYRNYVTKVKDKKDKKVEVSTVKSKETNELMKKKNYEIKLLKTELGKREQQLDLYKKQLTVAYDKEAKKVFSTPSPPSSAKTRRTVNTRPTSAKRPASAKLASRFDTGPPRPAREGFTSASSSEETQNSFENAIDNVVSENIEMVDGTGELTTTTSSSAFKREFTRPAESSYREIIAEGEQGGNLSELLSSITQREFPGQSETSYSYKFKTEIDEPEIIERRVVREETEPALQSHSSYSYSFKTAEEPLTFVTQSNQQSSGSTTKVRFETPDKEESSDF